MKSETRTRCRFVELSGSTEEKKKERERESKGRKSFIPVGLARGPLILASGWLPIGIRQPLGASGGMTTQWCCSARRWYGQVLVALVGCSRRARLLCLVKALETLEVVMQLLLLQRGVDEDAHGGTTFSTLLCCLCWSCSRRLQTSA